MSGFKTEFRFFTICDWQEEEQFLRRRHAAGWKFVGAVMPCFYHFERCEPEDVVYQLDYNPMTGGKNEYLQIFRDCGWEYIQDAAGYSYFRKPVSAMKDRDEEIFCDDQSRLEMLRRVFYGRVLVLLILFLTGLPLLLTRFWAYIQTGLGAALTLPVVLIMTTYAVLLIRFGLKYRAFSLAARR